MSDVIRIGHGNGHNEQSLVKWVADARADSFGCNEANQLIPALRKQGRVTVAGEGFKDRRARSTVTVTKKGRENLGQFTRRVSEKIERFERVAPDRVLVTSCFAHPLAQKLGFEGVAHFNLHPDAGPKVLASGPAKHPIVREYREALESTAVWMKSARKDGLLVVLTGDLQVPSHNTKPWSPNIVLAKRLDLDCWTTGIDWILFDKKVKLAARPVMRKLHDHTGFVAKLVER